jgi:two-component system LytT family sensor kinase
MKFFNKYIFPALYGLLVYFTIRLLHDTDIGMQFWKRASYINIIEMSSSIVVGYIGIAIFKQIIRSAEKHHAALSYEFVVKELLKCVFANLVLVNIVFVPMDTLLYSRWLPLADIVDINVVPTLYAVMYYGIVRSRVFLNAYVDNKIQLEKVTNDHLQTELKFLKSQYHPHFLFNALNTIYFQMDEDLEGAKNSIEKFSELLRYQLYDQQQQVPVINELDYLQSFIDLQKIRSSDKLQLQVNFDKALNGQQVYPLLFLPLVENAFKFIGGAYKLNIKATLTGNEIVFKVENSIPEFSQSVTKSGGIGLENLNRRLDLLYPGKYSLSAQKENGIFIAEMKLAYE